MSIQTEIERISNAVDNAYLAVVEKGGKLPSGNGVDDLPEAIDSISLEIPLDQMGDAEPKDVALGKTFTSSNGLKIEGTHDKSAPLDPVEVYNETRPKDWFQMPDILEDIGEIWLLVNFPKDGGGLLAFTVECTTKCIVYLYKAQPDGTKEMLTGITKFSPATFEFESLKTRVEWEDNGTHNVSWTYGGDPLITSDGMRQLLVQIKPTGSGTITSWAPATHSKKTSPSNYVSWNIVEIKAKLPNVESFSCKNLRTLRYFSLVGENNISDASNMFNGCYSLVAIPALDTSNVNNMSSMFNSCHSLISIPSLDTSKVTSMYSMFDKCYILPAIPALDTSNVTDTSRMFAYANVLISIPALNTSKVTSMYSMFDACRSLTSIPSLDTSNVTNMYSMFSSCYSLISIPSLETSNVTNMSNMFNGCNILTSIPSLDTSNVTNMSSMFSSCYSLISIPSLNTSNVTNMTNMFYGCRSLTSIPSLDTSNVTNMSSMFGYLYSLSHITLNPSVTNWAGLAIDLKQCSLSHDAIIDLFNSLPTITTSKALTLTGNPGVSDLTDEDKLIATNKHWTLTL